MQNITIHELTDSVHDALYDHVFGDDGEIVTEDVRIMHSNRTGEITLTLSNGQIFQLTAVEVK